MEKEWFNGFVANGLQFRLDGYMINDFGVTYHIGVKNISGHLVEIEDRVYFRFDYKKCVREMSSANIISKWEMLFLMQKYGIMYIC